MTEEEIEKEAKEYAQGNFYSEQGFLYGYERGFEEGRKKEADLIFESWCKGSDDEQCECGFLKKIEKENAELKEKLKGFENGDVAWQGDMDKTIKQNLELKEHCKAVDEVNFKLRNCYNCKNNNSKISVFCKYFNKCENKNYWELAE